MKEVIIKAENIKKSFENGDIVTHVLKGIDLEIYESQFVAIVGRSGAGKSTLLYQLSILDAPDSGEIYLNGNKTTHLNEKQKTAFRLRNLGFIFQDYALLPDLEAIENVSIPLLMHGFSKRDAFKESALALEKVGLGNRLHNLPSQLSGGEQQRVSIARAIVHKPKILFADEPTANLDSTSSETIIDLIESLHREGQTVVMVTHEEMYWKRAERIIHMEDGKILEDKTN